MKSVIFAVLMCSLVMSCQAQSELVEKMMGKLMKYDKFNREQLTNARLIMTECVNYTTDINQLSYILSTTIGECDLYCNEEEKAKEGTALWNLQKRYWYTGYYGRGFAQITWEEVYERFGRILKVDLVNKPELALDPVIASKIICMGLTKGLFTGVGLSKYINDEKCDFFNARRTLNILDKAQIFADRAKKI